VQSTAQFHHQIADPLLPQADPVFDDAATLDTTVDMLDPQPTLVQHLVPPLLRQREILAAWLLGRHDKPCHHLLYSGGAFARLYSVNPGSTRNHAAKTKKHPCVRYTFALDIWGLM
jgi:hypothetical protein